MKNLAKNILQPLAATAALHAAACAPVQETPQKPVIPVIYIPSVAAPADNIQEKLPERKDQADEPKVDKNSRRYKINHIMETVTSKSRAALDLEIEQLKAKSPKKHVKCYVSDQYQGAVQLQKEEDKRVSTTQPEKFYLCDQKNTMWEWSQCREAVIEEDPVALAVRKHVRQVMISCIQNR